MKPTKPCPPFTMGAKEHPQHSCPSLSSPPGTTKRGILAGRAGGTITHTEHQQQEADGEVWRSQTFPPAPFPREAVAHRQPGSASTELALHSPSPAQPFAPFPAPAVPLPGSCCLAKHKRLSEEDQPLSAGICSLIECLWEAPQLRAASTFLISKRLMLSNCLISPQHLLPFISGSLLQFIDGAVFSLSLFHRGCIRKSFHCRQRYLLLIDAYYSF